MNEDDQYEFFMSNGEYNEWLDKHMVSHLKHSYVQKHFKDPQPHEVREDGELLWKNGVDLRPKKCLVYNRQGKVIFEDILPVVELTKIFTDLFDHIEKIGNHSEFSKELTFRVW